MSEPASVRSGRRLVTVGSVSSTNDLAWRLASSETERPGILAVLADEQTSGRGRAGRTWSSPKGLGLYLSVHLPLGWPTARAALLTLAAGLAAARACGRLGVTPDLKWPNDLLAPDGSGRKLGGILTETRSESGRVAGAVIGLGLNVAHGEDDFEPALRGRATSLRLLGATGLAGQGAALALAHGVLDALEDEVRALDQPDGERRLIARWREASSLWGRPVRVEQGGRRIAGWARDLADDGGLVIRLESGAETVVHAGEVAVAWEES